MLIEPERDRRSEGDDEEPAEARAHASSLERRVSGTGCACRQRWTTASAHRPAPREDSPWSRRDGRRSHLLPLDDSTTAIRRLSSLSRSSRTAHAGELSELHPRTGCRPHTAAWLPLPDLAASHTARPSPLAAPGRGAPFLPLTACTLFDAAPSSPPAENGSSLRPRSYSSSSRLALSSSRASSSSVRSTASVMEGGGAEACASSARERGWPKGEAGRRWCLAGGEARVGGACGRREGLWRSGAGDLGDAAPARRRARAERVEDGAAAARRARSAAEDGLAALSAAGLGDRGALAGPSRGGEGAARARAGGGGGCMLGAVNGHAASAQRDPRAHACAKWHLDASPHSYPARTSGHGVRETSNRSASRTSGGMRYWCEKAQRSSWHRERAR